MNKLLYSILLLIIFIILISIFFKYPIDGFKNKVKDIKQNKNSTNCNKKGCPKTSKQNSLYKMHVEFKPERDKNHMISHNTQSGNFFFKTNGPANIFIIRHGEKIKSKNSLDCNGILRSTYIPELIVDLNNKGFGIHAIITSFNYRSMHQEQTISLSSWLMDIPVYMFGQSFQQNKAVNEIFTNPYFRGKSVLFCWEHQCIQGLVNSIITIGPKIKGLTNYKFVNTDKNSNLPYWDINNYKSIMYFDENLNYKTMEEKFTTCFTSENNLLTYTGQMQHCQK